MPSTLLLNPSTWDLLVDAERNIAMASPPYALAQDAASQIRYFQGDPATGFQGDDYYDTTKGVPYWQQVLGRQPPIPLVKSYFVAAALLVPDVVAAQCFIDAITDRIVGAPSPSGQVQITDVNGNLAAVGF